KPSIYDQSFSDIHAWVKKNELSEFTPRFLFNWLYKKNAAPPYRGNLKQETVQAIQDNFDFSLPKICYVYESHDGIVKFLLELGDGKKIETVLLPFLNKYSLCLSSQVGCAMSCSFCFTGTQGLSRHLKTSEIVGQYLVARTWLEEKRGFDQQILTLVFM